MASVRAKFYLIVLETQKKNTSEQNCTIDLSHPAQPCNIFYILMTTKLSFTIMY